MLLFSLLCNRDLDREKNGEKERRFADAVK